MALATSNSRIKMSFGNKNRLSTSVLGLFVLFLISYNVSANDFWQPIGVDQGSSSYSSQGGQASLSFTNSDSVSYRGNQYRSTQLVYNQNLNDSTALSFGYDNAYKQRSMMMGLTHRALSVSYMSGTGDEYARIANDYAGISPYLLHAGGAKDFDYSGYAVDYGFKRVGHLQFGQANLQSVGLEARKAKYFEWSNNNLFARATKFQRGVKSIGYAFDTGLSFANKKIAFQTLQTENDKRIQRVRLSVNRNEAQQYWFDISSHHNPLYQDNDDYQVMVTFKTLLGVKPSAFLSHATNPDTQDETAKPTSTKKQKWKRGVFIGAGVVAAAALSSSGSDAQDNNARFNSQNEAALDILNQINPKSVRENREYGGFIYINADGSYMATNEVSGDIDSVDISATLSSIPQNSNPTASYHTHGGFDARYDNENFSPADLDSDKALGVDGYLGTPAGYAKYHEVTTEKISVIGRIAN